MVAFLSRPLGVDLRSVFITTNSFAVLPASHDQAGQDAWPFVAGRHGDSRFLRAQEARVATSVHGKTHGTRDTLELLFLGRNEGMPYPRFGPRRWNRSYV